MSRPLLVCRPQPGASATAEAARALGLDPVVAPLFDVQAVAWDPPAPGRFDALMMTSANAARHAGPALARYAALPAFAVGGATAAAMRGAGLTAVTGEGDADALIAAIGQRGHRRVLHLCGEDYRTAAHADLQVHAVPVYRAVAVASLSGSAIAAVGRGAVVLLHSPRAAALFAGLAKEVGLDVSGTSIVAISRAAADAVGLPYTARTGWLSVDAAPVPTDDAMLAIARKLCENPLR